jgi:hypothetical protein
MIDVPAENRSEETYLPITNHKVCYLVQPAVCQESGRGLAELAAKRLLTLVPRVRIFFFFSSALKMEAIRSSETSVKRISTRRLLTLVLRLRIFFFILLPLRWRRYVPPKRLLTQYLHGATSQKTAFFIVTAMKNSDLTFADFV